MTPFFSDSLHSCKGTPSTQSHCPLAERGLLAHCQSPRCAFQVQQRTSAWPYAYQNHLLYKTLQILHFSVQWKNDLCYFSVFQEHHLHSVYHLGLRLPTSQQVKDSRESQRTLKHRLQEAHSNREHLKECKTAYLTWAYLLWQEPEAWWALRARRRVSRGLDHLHAHTQGNTSETHCTVTTRLILWGIMGGTVPLQDRLGLQVILRCLPKQESILSHIWLKQLSRHWQKTLGFQSL